MPTITTLDNDHVLLTFDGDGVDNVQSIEFCSSDDLNAYLLTQGAAMDIPNAVSDLITAVQADPAASLTTLQTAAATQTAARAKI
jgi:hypothetical protein